MNLELLPIGKTFEENAAFVGNPDCTHLQMTIDYFNLIGHEPPWIGYFVKKDGQFVGSAAFKGAPFEGRVEIAYGTNEAFRQQGIATAICKALVELSVKTDPAARITARTLPEENYSTRVLKKNGFKFAGSVIDKEDGEVWEWELGRTTSDEFHDFPK